MDDITYKVLKQGIGISLRVLREDPGDPLQIIPESSTVDDAIDLIRSLLPKRDQELLKQGIKKVRSSAVKEYLDKMRKIEEERNEEARRILEEMTDNPQPKKKYPGKLLNHEDRDGNLPTMIFTVDDYKE